MPAGGTGNHTEFPHLLEFIARGGRGGRVWDESGNEYIDFLPGSGSTPDQNRSMKPERLSSFATCSS